MSHCLIVELSEEPIAVEDRVTADWFDDCEDIRSVADYVQNIEDTGNTYEEAVDMFIKELGAAVTYNEEDNSITFINPEKFFEEDFKIVKELVEKATLKDFMSNSWSYKIRERIQPLFGTYIYHTNECSYSLHEFLRYYKNGEKLYLGGICDYHC